MDDHVAQLIAQSEDDERARAQAIARAWQVYEGAPRPSADSDEIRLNLAGLIVDTGVDFLFGDDLGLDVEGDAQEDERDVWLAGAWGERMMTRLQAAATHGAVGGHAILRILPVDGADPRTVPPRILALSPQHYSAVWDPADVDTLLAQVIRWSSRDGRGREVSHRQVLEPTGNAWLVTEQESRAEFNGRWTTTSEITWPHPWSPIVDCQNLLAPASYYGRPDLTQDVLDTQDAVNDSLSRTSRKDRLHNKRVFVAKGFSPAQQDEFEEEQPDVVYLPATDSELAAIDAASGQVSDSLELYRSVKAALHEISRVPEVTAGRLDNIGQLSGLALQILYGPIVRKTETKRRLYGAMVAEVSRRLLDLGGFGPPEAHKVELRWPSILPTDEEAEARAALARQDAGVSINTTLGELGYDPEVEEERRAEEATERAERAARLFDRGAERPTDE